jgi:hypothetical protein
MRTRPGCPSARKNSALNVSRSGRELHVTMIYINIIVYACRCYVSASSGAGMQPCQLTSAQSSHGRCDRPVEPPAGRVLNQ